MCVGFASSGPLRIISSLPSGSVEKSSSATGWDSKSTATRAADVGLPLVGVESQDLETGLGKFCHERKADVAEADNADYGLTLTDTLYERMWIQ